MLDRVCSELVVSAGMNEGESAYRLRLATLITTTPCYLIEFAMTRKKTTLADPLVLVDPSALSARAWPHAPEAVLENSFADLVHQVERWWRYLATQRVLTQGSGSLRGWSAQYRRWAANAPPNTWLPSKVER
jgi:hypothetical protein